MKTHTKKNLLWSHMGFHDSSVGKESACNAGEPSSIPGSGRSSGEGIGYPLQYSWAFIVAQLVKNPLSIWETWVWSLGWEDPLEKGKATHSSILSWRIPWTVQPMGSQRVWATWLSNFHFTSALKCILLSGLINPFQLPDEIQCQNANKTLDIISNSIRKKSLLLSHFKTRLRLWPCLSTYLIVYWHSKQL